MRVLVDHRAERGRGVVGRADANTRDGFGKAGAERLVGGADHDDARAGGALLAGEADRRGRATPRTASSRSASSSTMIAFLPPISAMTRLISRWPGRDSAASSMIDRPTACEPVKAISATRGSLDQNRADLLAVAGQEVGDAGRHAGRFQRLHQEVADARRLLGRLDHDGVAGDQRGGGHAGQDGEREVPRRDDHRRRRARS